MIWHTTTVACSVGGVVLCQFGLGSDYRTALLVDRSLEAFECSGWPVLESAGVVVRFNMIRFCVSNTRCLHPFLTPFLSILFSDVCCCFRLPVETDPHTTFVGKI